MFQKRGASCGICLKRNDAYALSGRRLTHALVQQCKKGDGANCPYYQQHLYGWRYEWYGGVCPSSLALRTPRQFMRFFCLCPRLFRTFTKETYRHAYPLKNNQKQNRCVASVSCHTFLRNAHPSRLNEALLEVGYGRASDSPVPCRDCRPRIRGHDFVRVYPFLLVGGCI